MSPFPLDMLLKRLVSHGRLTVIGPDGDELGETPLSTEWPSSTDPVSFTLTLRGYRDKRIELDVTQNVATRVPLTKVRATSSKSGRDGKTQLNLYDPDLTRVEYMEFTPAGKTCCSEFTAAHPTATESH